MREFFAVTLPALRGEIAVALTLSTIAALRNFDLVYITTKGGPGDATSVPAYQVYERAFLTGKVGSAVGDRPHPGAASSSCCRPASTRSPNGGRSDDQPPRAVGHAT